MTHRFFSYSLRIVRENTATDQSCVRLYFLFILCHADEKHAHNTFYLYYVKNNKYSLIICSKQILFMFFKFYT